MHYISKKIVFITKYEMNIYFFLSSHNAYIYCILLNQRISDILIKRYKYEYPYLLTNLTVHICYVYYHIKMEYLIFSQVIVTYLDITEHQATILKTGKLDSEKATICYSRPYDYMNDGDRSHILKLFFLFGFMQSKFLEDIF